MPRQENAQFDEALAVLRGSRAYFIAVVLSFVCSIFASFGSIATIDDLALEVKYVASLATLFLVSSTFTVAKHVRDTQLAAILDDEGVEGAQLLNGTAAWLAQVWFSFIVALFASSYSVVTLQVDWDVKSFVLMGLLFTLSATLSLAKVVRDRQDAAYFEGKPQYLEAVRSLAVGSAAHTLACWSAFLIDIVSFLFGLLNDEDIVIERKGFLLMGVTFMIYSTFMLAKAVRDSASPNASLAPSSLHWLMYTSGFVLSGGMTLGAILHFMPFTAPQRAFLSLATVCILSVTFNLAKLVRDKQEANSHSHSD